LLQVDYFRNPIHPENVVVASDPFREFQVMQQVRQFGESNVCIGVAAQDRSKTSPCFLLAI